MRENMLGAIPGSMRKYRGILLGVVIAHMLIATPVFAQDANVMAIQQALQSQGFDPGEADGLWGSKTEQAVRGFQQKMGLLATGKLDAETARSLGVKPHTPAARTGSSKQETSRQAKNANIMAAQRALQSQGFDPGPADGVWGSKTERAVRDFQHEKGLLATGKLDTETARSLGVQPSTPAARTGNSKRMTLRCEIEAVDNTFMGVDRLGDEFTEVLTIHLDEMKYYEFGDDGSVTSYDIKKVDKSVIYLQVFEKPPVSAYLTIDSQTLEYDYTSMGESRIFGNSDARRGTCQKIEYRPAPG